MKNKNAAPRLEECSRRFSGTGSYIHGFSCDEQKAFKKSISVVFITVAANFDARCTLAGLIPLRARRTVVYYYTHVCGRAHAHARAVRVCGAFKRRAYTLLC